MAQKEGKPCFLLEVGKKIRKEDETMDL